MCDQKIIVSATLLSHLPSTWPPQTNNIEFLTYLVSCTKLLCDVFSWFTCSVHEKNVNICIMIRQALYFYFYISLSFQYKLFPTRLNNNHFSESVTKLKHSINTWFSLICRLPIIGDWWQMELNGVESMKCWLLQFRRNTTQRWVQNQTLAGWKTR